MNKLYIIAILFLYSTLIALGKDLSDDCQKHIQEVEDEYEKNLKENKKPDVDIDIEKMKYSSKKYNLQDKIRPYLQDKGEKPSIFDIVFNFKVDIKHLIVDKLFVVLSFLVIIIITLFGIKNTCFAKPTKKETNPFKILALIAAMVIMTIVVGITSIYGIVHSRNYQRYNKYANCKNSEIF